MPAVAAGYKKAPKKVDAESYMPPPGDWEETNIVWDFGDGWLICEDRTEYDRRLMAKLTLTCVANLHQECIPGPDVDVMRAKYARQVNDFYPHFTQAKKDEWVEQQVKINDMTGKGIGKYKLLHVRDPEGRPRSCILAVLKDIIDNPKPGVYVHYGNSYDLGQKVPVILDDMEFVISEVRLGTGKAAPMAVEERVIQWFQAVTGTWNEEAYLHAQIARREYAAITDHPTEDALRAFRREVLDAA